MADGRSRVRQAALWVAVCAGAVALVVAVSVTSGRAAPVEGPALPQPPQVQPMGPLPEPAEPSPVAPPAAAAWARFRPGTDILVRAADVVELRGVMARGEGPDNEDVVTAKGEPARVSFVWCKDDGRAEKEVEDDDAAPAAEHSAVFLLTVSEARTYYPWARVWWEDGCGDSIFVALERDGQELQSYTVQDGTHVRWHWLPVAGEAGLAFQTGTYRVVVRNREDGARLSRILFCARSYGVYKPETPEG